MKHLILQQFWDSIPQEKLKHVRRKLPYYLKILTQERGNISNMPKGFYARRIRGTTDKYKFRVANDDRVLFIYADDIQGIRMENKCGIVLLAYCSHDEQIRRGRKLEVTGNEEFSEHDFTLQRYTEETETARFCEIEASYANVHLMIDNTRVYQVDDHELAQMAEEGVKDWQYYLNNEQYNCVQIHDRPVFLSGGAGTGKSTIGLHKLFALSKNKDARLAYFTYTKTLKDDFAKMYNQYQSDHSKNNPGSLAATVEFHSLNEFCFTILGRKPANLVDFRKFEKSFCTEYWPLFQNVQIHKLDIWQEIRGLIKGFMGRYWLRNEIFTNLTHQLQPQTLELLLTQGFIEQIDKERYMLIKNRQSLFSDTDDAERLIDALLAERLDREKILNDIKKIKKQLKQGRFASPFISKEIYLSLEDEDCIFSREDRNQIYTITEKYQEWLENDNKFDENDLVRSMLMTLEKGKVRPIYDYIMVDEVQDLSELQIYLLLSLKKNKASYNEFFFSGDIHQMINPTYFSFSRLRMPFHYCHVEKELQLLEKNYRSQENIVHLSNKIGQLCKTFIGAKDNFNAIPLQSAGNVPFWLMPSTENRQQLFSTLQRKDRKYAIIVVPNDAEKKRIKEEIGSVERVFTVQEIKGLEYDYVVCVNMLTPFLNEWQDIVEGRGKKNAKYRYYFNIFYVALTRARRNLCIYEDNSKHPLLLHIGDFLQQIAQFDANRMDLKRSASRQEVLNDARNQERLGNYDQAIQGYRDLKDQFSVVRCEAKILREQGLHLAAVKKFLEARAKDEAWEHAEELEDDKLRLFVVLHIMSTPEDMEEMFGKPLAMLHEIIAREVTDSEFIELVYERYLIPKFKEYQKKCDDCLNGIEMIKKEFGSYE